MREERGRDDELVDGQMEADTMAGHDGVTSDGANIRHQMGSERCQGGLRSVSPLLSSFQTTLISFDNSHFHWKRCSDGSF